jgi:hypothetical protein
MVGVVNLTLLFLLAVVVAVEVMLLRQAAVQAAVVDQVHLVLLVALEIVQALLRHKVIMVVMA